MSNLDYQQPANQFLEAISLWEVGYKSSGFSYHARRDGNDLLILHGQLVLRGWKDRLPESSIRFADQEVGHFSFSRLGLSIHEFITQILSGSWIQSPNGRMRLSNSSAQPVQAHYQDFHQEGLSNGHRFAHLRLTGGQFERPRLLPQLDWELKAAEIPYDGMWEVLSEYQLVGYSGDFSAIELLAFQIAEVNIQSQVDGETSHPGIYLAAGLDRGKCRLGYRIQEQGRITFRGTIHSSELEWRDIEHPDLGYCQYGVATLSVPLAAGIHCYAVYDGVTQHQCWIGDWKRFPNWKRAALEEFDADCEELLDRLFSEKKHKQEGSRILERGVAWLLWLLGFSVIHLDSKKTERGPDLLATTPNGRMAIIECTTDIIDTEKLGKLVARKNALSTRLQASSAGHVELLPVLITPLPRADLIKLDQASALGVAVMAREDLEAAHSHALIFQDADELFRQLALTIAKTSTSADPT